MTIPISLTMNIFFFTSESIKVSYLKSTKNLSAFWSHIDNTIYSSIKLYLHKDTKTITSPITLTVFTYKDENDFIDGHYRGNSKYTITINNK